MVFILKKIEENDLINQGNEIIIKIDNYKIEKGKLPESLSDIGIKETEEGPIFYKKRIIVIVDYFLVRTLMI